MVRSIKGLLTYGAMLSFSGVGIWLIRAAGSDRSPSSIANPTRAAGAAHGNTLFHVLLALVVVIIASPLLSMLAPDALATGAKAAPRR
jgi:hypothetical protein